MINKETHTIDWIFNLKNKLGKQVDAKLIEKVIWALTLLEQLQLNGLNFTFKGGTALVLATEKPKRFSIDIDIITEHTEKKIKIEKFKNPLETKDWLIEDQQYNKISKLKKNNPEAFYYWYKSFKI